MTDNTVLVVCYQATQHQDSNTWKQKQQAIDDSLGTSHTAYDF